MKVAIVEKNQQGCYFERGKSFSRAKWYSMVNAYETELISAGKYTVNRLVKLAKIGTNSANKAIRYFDIGFIPSRQRKNAKGVGSLKGLKMKHHAFIYALYLSNPALPNYG